MDEVRILFDGLELVEPGLVIVPDWRGRGGSAGRLRSKRHDRRPG